MKHQPLFVVVNFGIAIKRQHLPECRTERLPKIDKPAFVSAELSVQRWPCHQGWFSWKNAVQPLREPGINIQCHGVMGQRPNVGLDEWNGVVV